MDVVGKHNLCLAECIYCLCSYHHISSMSTSYINLAIFCMCAACVVLVHGDTISSTL